MSIIKPHLLKLSPYKPPLEGRDARKHTLLDFNERTIPVSTPITDALQSFIVSGRLQQYPAYGDIVERLADYAGVQVQQLMITNGSDQGIDLVFRAVAKEGGEAIIPAPSFAIYNQCAKVENLKIIEPLYTAKMGYPVNEVLSSINLNTAIVVISNPNNPSGTLVSVDNIERIAQRASNAAVLIDECYFEYSKLTAVSLLKKYSNIFITRTFSKTWGIPSLRFAYLMASPESIHALCNVRGPYDINQLAVVAANAALDHPEYTQQYVEEVMGQAKPLLEQWLENSGIEFWPSGANYVWAFPQNPELLANHLTQNNILVRPKIYCNQTGLRITIGTLAQTQKLIKFWSELSTN